MTITKKLLIIAIFISVNTQFMGNEKNQAAPIMTPMQYPQLGGKGPGMGHDYQKNTPGPGKGKPNYQGGQTSPAEPSLTGSSKSDNHTNNPAIKKQKNSQAEGLPAQRIEGDKEEQKNLNSAPQILAPTKRQRDSGVGFPGYRGQGGTGYKQHRQFGTPPLNPKADQTKQSTQLNNNLNSGQAAETIQDNRANKNNSQNKATENRRALLHAAAFGDLNTVNKMLKLGVSANVKAKDKNARSVLILAAAGGHLDVVSELLKNGAKVDERDSTGNTALNWAAMRSRNDVALLLLKNGADINTQNNVEVSPLLYAVGTNNSKLVKLLLAHEADIEVISRKNKMTPLLLAIENKNKDILQILIDKGAKVSSSNKERIKKIMSTDENS